MRIFLDANVLFSAAKTAGAMRSMLDRLNAMGHSSFADGYVIAEARRNLEAKGSENAAELDTILEIVEVVPFGSTDVPADAARLLPEKDRRVLAAAIRLDCDALVTGDRTHFGPLYGRTIYGVMIHSPHSLAKTLSL